MFRHSKKIIAAFSLMTMVAFFPQGKTHGAVTAMGTALDFSAEVLEAKGQDTQWTLTWFAIKKSWEKAAEFLGQKQRELIADLSHQPIDKVYSVWEKDMLNFSKAIETALQVSKAVEKVGGGDYGEATLHTLYAGAELLGNPIVKLMAAAALYTAESYKQVQETGVALRIEALYGALDSDRRLLGTPNPQTDTPALIPLDDDTVNYIYQKYIWDCEEPRRLIVAYFNEKGTGWPAEEWARLYYTYSIDSTTADPKRRANLETLNNDFKRKVIPWVRILIKDVNAQAKFRWAQMRLQYAASGMKDYMLKMSQAKNSFANIGDQLKSLEGMKSQIPEWQKWLGESPAARDKAAKLLQDPKRLKEAQTLCESWLSRMRISASGAQVVGEMKLCEALKVERQAWYEIEKTMGSAVSKQQEAVVKDPMLTYATPPTEDLTDEMKSYQQNFEPVMAPYDDWALTPDVVLADVLAFLNQGKVAEAYERDVKWRQELPKINNYYFGDTGLRKTLDDQKKAAAEGPTNRLIELNAAVQALNNKIYAVDARIRAIGAGDGLSQLWTNLLSEKAGLQTQINNYQSEINKLNQTLSDLEKAHGIAWEVLRSLKEMSDAEHSDILTKIGNMLGVVGRLKEARERQWQQYQGILTGIESELPIEGNEFSYAMNEQVAQATAKIDEAMKKAKESSYTTVGSFTEAESLGELLSSMTNRAGNIKGGAAQFEEITRLMTEIESLSAQWQLAADNWENIEKLSLEDQKEIQVLVDAAGIETLSKRITAIDGTIIGFPDLITKMKGKVDEYLKFNDSEVRDRQKDADWLESKSVEVRAFLKAQEDKKVLKNKGGSDYNPDYEFVVEKSLDMGIMNTPYRHYILESDIAAYAQEVETDWARYPGFQFIKTYAPKVYEKLKALLKPTGIKLATEENLIARTGTNSDITIWKSALEKLEQAVDAVQYDASDLKFSQQMITVTNVQGLGAIVGAAADGKKVRYAVETNYKNYADDYNNTLGSRYVAALEKLQKTFDKREEYLATTATTGPGGTSWKPGEKPSGPGGTGEKPSGPGADGPGAGGPGGGTPQGPGGPGGTPTKGSDDNKPKDPGAWKGGPGGGYIKNRASMGFYQLYDARLNTHSLQNASGGEVVVTTADLRSGGIETTARLSTMDMVKTLLVSEDGGRTWTEIPVNQNISYRFTPMADKRYQLVLKVKTTDLQEPTIEFFPNINAIVYRNINYTDLVRDVVEKIASAYESQNTAAFADLIARDYLGNRVYLEEGIRFDFDMFTDIRLKIFIDRIEQRNSLYLADTHWEKSQNPRKTGQQQMTTGKTVMTFVLEDGKLKIKNLRGDLIYATLSPDIAEASGLPQTIVEEIRVANFERNPVQPGAGETENSGGVSATATLTVRNGTVTNAGIMMGFDFSSGTQVAMGAGDFNFNGGQEFSSVGAAGIQGGSGSFDSITEAPAGGYGPSEFVNIVGTVLVFRTIEGYYGKMRVTSYTDNFPISRSVSFEYAVQTDGSRNIAT